MVHDVANILESEQPCLGGTFTSIHKPFHVLLDVTPSMFSEVLVLIMGFAVPIINAQGTKDVLSAVGEL